MGVSHEIKSTETTHVRASVSKILGVSVYWNVGYGFRPLWSRFLPVRPTNQIAPVDHVIRNLIGMHLRTKIFLADRKSGVHKILKIVINVTSGFENHTFFLLIK